MKTIPHLEKSILAAFDDLNVEIEAEMWKLIKKHKSIGTILKCMGEVTIYDKEGHWLYDAPAYAKRLYALADLDWGYYCLTGKPLKLKRNPDRSIVAVTNW